VDTVLRRTVDRCPPTPIPLSPASAILLAVWFGLCAGYLDVALIVRKKLCWNPAFP